MTSNKTLGLSAIAIVALALYYGQVIFGANTALTSGELKQLHSTCIAKVGSSSSQELEKFLSNKDLKPYLEKIESSEKLEDNNDAHESNTTNEEYLIACLDEAKAELELAEKLGAKNDQTKLIERLL